MRWRRGRQRRTKRSRLGPLRNGRRRKGDENAYNDLATFERDPDAWKSYLIYQGADDTSIAEMFLLAQMSDAGWEKANTLMSKLLKKEADGEAFSNVSAFIHCGVQNARKELGMSWEKDKRRGDGKWWDEKEKWHGSWGSSSWEEKDKSDWRDDDKWWESHNSWAKDDWKTKNW